MKLSAKLIFKKIIDKIYSCGKLLFSSEVLKAMMPGKKNFRVFLFFTGWKKRAKKLSKNKLNCFFWEFLSLRAFLFVKIEAVN